MPRIRNVGGVRPQPFLYVPAVSNIVTNGNGTGTKNVIKGTVRFGLSLVSSLLSSWRYYCSESTWTRSTVSFYSCKRRNLPRSNIGILAPKLTLLLRPCICGYDYWDS